MLRKFFQILVVCALCTLCLKHAQGYSQSCGKLGLSTGTECGLKALPVDVISSCLNPDTSVCVIQDCPNGCECVEINHGCGSSQPICSSCDDDTPWISNVVKHYDRQTYYILNTSTCNCSSFYRYRCHIGYYDSKEYSSVTSEPTCVQCPCLSTTAGTSVCGTTDIKGSASVYSCYLETNDDFEDSFGEWDLTSNCPYTNQ